jgi:pimeloyl-ACP methyl ester carboxylesterase
MGQLQLFHHRISGNASGHKLVFLHGLMGSLSNWRRIVPDFEERFEILTFDQRGHGRSPKPLEGYSPADFAEDLKMLIDELHWQKIDLVGHSMGGRNALEFANRFPDRLGKLVIEDIGPGTAKETQAIIERLINLVPTPFPDRASARAFFENDYERLISFHSQPRVIRQFFYTNLEDQSDQTVNWRFYKPGILEALRIGHAQNRWDLIDRLNTPTLWLRGQDSTDLPRPVFEAILDRNPVITGHEIAGAGHWIHFDQPTAFIKAVKDFLTLGNEVG